LLRAETFTGPLCGKGEREALKITRRGPKEKAWEERGHELPQGIIKLKLGWVVGVTYVPPQSMTRDYFWLLPFPSEA